MKRNRNRSQRAIRRHCSPILGRGRMTLGRIRSQRCAVVNASTAGLPSTDHVVESACVTVTGTKRANRAGLDHVARLVRLVPVGGVTKSGVTKGCAWLVAADPRFASGIARIARNRGAPIIGVEAFLDTTCVAGHRAGEPKACTDV